MSAAPAGTPLGAPDFLLVHAEGECVRVSILQADGAKATLLIDAGSAESISGILFTEAARARKRQAERKGAHDGNSGGGGAGGGEPLDAPDKPLRGVLVSTVALSPALSETDGPELPETWREPWN